MKILLIIVGCLIGLILAVTIVGLLLPKRHVVSRSASYHAKPEQLFSLIAGAQDWRPEVVRCETTADSSGKELQRETTRNGETVTYELTDRVAPVSLKRRIVTKNLPYSGTWTFSLEANDDSTLVRITEDGEVYNPIFRFVSRFVFGQTQTIDNYLRALGKATGQRIEIRD